MAVENKARIWGALGQSGTGKGLWVKAELKSLNPKRMLILDPQDEYGAFAIAVTSAAEMARVIVNAGDTGPFRIRYVFPKSCTKDHFAKIFDLACRLTYAAKNCVFLVEELSNFTQASWAPPLWKRMCNSGRHEGVHVIACSQFPAQVDKSFLSNATLLHVGYLGEEPHRKAIATRLDITTDRIKALPDLHFFEWHREGRKLYRGDITITGRIRQDEWREGDEKTTPERSIKPPSNEEKALKRAAEIIKITPRGKRIRTGGARAIAAAKA